MSDEIKGKYVALSAAATATFTDDDVKRIKGNLVVNGPADLIYAEELTALLARMEAAEASLEYFLPSLGSDLICPCCNTHPHVPRCALENRLNDWRKACGGK